MVVRFLPKYDYVIFIKSLLLAEEVRLGIANMLDYRFAVVIRHWKQQ